MEFLRSSDFSKPLLKQIDYGESNKKSELKRIDIFELSSL